MAITSKHIETLTHEEYKRLIKECAAEGGYPPGTCVCKVMSEPGDIHARGAMATIKQGIRVPGDERIAYFLEWDDIPDSLAFVMGSKIERAE